MARMTPADAEPLLRAYQRQEREFVERRFPLVFDPENVAIRELYSQAKGLAWDPDTDIAWDRLDPAAYDASTREAARLTWSRRAWGAYPGLGESTALLIRLCLESGAHFMDAKLFLSFRPAEEAKHLETCHRFAERLGGYVDEPGGDLRRVTNHPFAQMALDRAVPVEAFVAAVGGLDDQLDLGLTLGHLHGAKDEVARQALRLIAADKQRHVLFAWSFLASRAPALDDAGRRAVAETVGDVLQNVVLRGYRTTWLLPEGERTRWSQAEALTAEHGLGACTAAQEQGVVRATVARVRERLAVWGIALPPATHPELGRL
jgi:hypothetical protein